MEEAAAPVVVVLIGDEGTVPVTTDETICICTVEGKLAGVETVEIVVETGVGLPVVFAGP